MKAVRGCVNGNCVARKNRIHYKSTDDYCPKCGRPLSFVCRDCFKQMPDDTQQYCVECAAKHKDRQDHFKEGAEKFGTVLLAAAGSVAVGVKMLLKGIKKE